jgi:hypothetical protein
MSESALKESLGKFVYSAWNKEQDFSIQIELIAHFLENPQADVDDIVIREMAKQLDDFDVDPEYDMDIVEYLDGFLYEVVHSIMELLASADGWTVQGLEEFIQELNNVIDDLSQAIYDKKSNIKHEFVDLFTTHLDDIQLLLDILKQGRAHQSRINEQNGGPVIRSGPEVFKPSVN